MPQQRLMRNCVAVMDKCGAFSGPKKAPPSKPPSSRAARFAPYRKAPRPSWVSPSSGIDAAAEAGEGWKGTGILTIGPPPCEPFDGSATERKDDLGSFLRGCSSCGKRIGDGDAVFMYGVFHAFCSKECQEKKINLDGGVKN